MNYYQDDDSRESSQSSMYDEQNFSTAPYYNENCNVSSTPTHHFQYAKGFGRNFAILQANISPFAQHHVNTNFCPQLNDSQQYGSHVPTTPTNESHCQNSYNSIYYRQTESRMRQTISSSFDDSCYGSMNLPSYSNVRTTDTSKLFTIDSILNDQFSLKDNDGDFIPQTTVKGNLLRNIAA